MIKFFRRIRQNILSEGKTRPNNSVGRAEKPASPIGRYLIYAIGEIILVVFGILIALQINNWNQDRIYNKERTYLISELLSEFEDNLDQINTVVSANENFISKIDTLVAKLPTLNFPGDEQKLSEMLLESRVVNIATTSLSAGMINSISNTSNFQHIKDKFLRRNLLNWSGYVDDMKENEILAYEHSQVIMPDYLSKFSVIGDLEMARNLKMEGDIVLNLLELRNKLMHNRTLKRHFTNEAKGLTKKMEEVIQQLKKELASAAPPAHLITITKNELEEYVGVYKITNANRSGSEELFEISIKDNHLVSKYIGGRLKGQIYYFVATDEMKIYKWFLFDKDPRYEEKIMFLRDGNNRISGYRYENSSMISEAIKIK